MRLPPEANPIRPTYPQSHPKHVESDLANEPEVEPHDPEPKRAPCCTERCEPDLINHPPHYTHGLIETIDMIESQGWGKGFNCGNALKYLTRHEHKGEPIKDLEKAAWYLNREIERERKLRE